MFIYMCPYIYIHIPYIYIYIWIVIKWLSRVINSVVSCPYPSSLFYLMTPLDHIDFHAIGHRAYGHCDIFL